MNKLFYIGLLMLCCSASANAQVAEDRIVYGPALPRSANLWSPHPTLVLTGKIEKLDQVSVEFISSENGQRRKLPSDRIERVEVNWETPAAAEAHARFVKREYVAVLKNNDEVLRAGGFPRWQQVILLTEIVQSFEAIGKPEAAGKYFLVLAQQSPPDFLFATIPLNWNSRESSPAMSKAAKEWLEDKDEVAGLLGASWLLLGEQGAQAKQRLQKLQSSTNRVVARMAAVQLWRTVPPTETASRMEKWLEARDSLSLPMQLGPTEFLAERFSRVDRPALAIGEWLRIAATYAEHSHRAALALEQAGERLSRTEFSEKDSQVSSARAWREELQSSK